jgi:PAS domain S-box-containing protein
VIRPNVLLVLLATGILLLAAVSGDAQDKSPTETPIPNAFLETLSAPERAWLRAHPVIRVAQDPDWPPIEFTDERGTPSGMTADYLRLVEDRLGVEFQQVENLSWQEAYARMMRWEIDMTTSVSVTSERETFWAFTKPYMTIPLVIVTRSDVTYIADLRELEGKKVAVVAGYVAETWIARDFPEIQLVMAQTTQEALAKLQRGEVFACVENMLVVDRAITKLKMSGLKITGSTPYHNAQCMAVRKDWAVLAGILDQALDSISATERNAIFRKWLPLQSQSAFDYIRLWPVAAILGVVLMGLGAWNWKLAAEIRQRRQAEAALRASEQEFRSLAEAMPQIVWSTRPDGWNIYFNQQWVDYTGLTLAESYGHGWNKPFHPDDQQHAWDAWQHATKNGAIYSMECRLRRADGVYRWWLVRSTPLRDTDGRILKWFGTCTDIEDIKQTESALQMFVMLADCSSEFIGMCDLDLQPLYVNSAGMRLVGLADMAAARQVKVPDYFFSEDQRFITEEFFPRVMREGHGDTEIRLRHFQTGEPIWMFYYLFSIRDASGKSVGWATVSRDITERKQAEEALSQSRQAAVNLMVDAVAARDRAEQMSLALQEKLAELERMNKLMVGRENRMIELKRELNELCRQLNLPPRYTAPEMIVSARTQTEQ